MSISKVSNRWLNRFYKIIAILLVTFAVLISSLRLLLPYAHNYRLDFQNYINSTYQSNIVIGSLHMDWTSSGPSMVANNVSFLQTDGAEIFIGSIDFNLDFWRSLRQLNLVTKALTLDGVKVFVDKTLIKKAGDNQQLTLVDNVIDLFLQRINRFSLNNSQVVYRTEKAERIFLINELNWLNRGNQHRAEGQVIIDGLTSNNLNISLAVEGKKLTEMQGMLYVKANKVNITPWLDKVLAIKDEDTHSSINFDAWLSIEKGGIHKVQVALGDNQIAWQHLASTQTFDVKQGHLLFDNIDDSQNFTLNTSSLSFSSNDRNWQPLQIAVTAKNNEYHGYMSTLDAKGIAQLVPLFTNHTEVRELLYGLSPEGSIHDLLWQFKEEQLSVNAQFSELAVNYYQGIPKVNHVSGEVIYRDKQLLINLNSQNGEIDFNKHFIQPIPYQSLAATVSLFFKTNQFLTKVENIEFLSDEITLSGELAVEAINEQPVTMALLVDLQNVDAKNASHYYPQLLMGKDLVNYLNQSLISGQVKQAQVLFNGPLVEFPFTQHQGVFTVDAELINSTFQFDPKWSAIKNFNGNLNFTNNSMLITGRSGLLEGIDVTGVTARIDELIGAQILQIDAGFAQTQANDVTRLMQKSPLADSVGAVLEQVKISDDIAGTFALTIPLADTHNTVAKGTVHFSNNQVALQAPAMLFKQVNGQLNFTNDVITTENIALLWRDMPLKLNVTAKTNANYYQTDININALWPQQSWQQQLPQLLKSYAEGPIQWQGELTLKNGDDGQFNYELSVLSDLADTQLKLPAPYTKAKGKKRSVFAKVKGDIKQSTIDAVVGEQFNFYGVLDHDLATFSRAHLILGREDMLLPLSGFHITANLAEADLLQWQPLVVDIIDSIAEIPASNNNTPPLLAQPQRIRGNIAQLHLLDETLDDVSFNLLDQQSWWLLELTSEQARADVKFFPDWLKQGIAVNADFINIANNAVAASSSKQTAVIPIPEKTKAEITKENAIIDKVFANVPPVSFSCKHCQYNGLDLGQVDFSIKRENDELIVLNNFIAKRKKNSLNFDLKWQKLGNDYLTNIDGELDLDDVEQELKQLGFASLIKDSGVTTSYNLKWQGAPYQWNVETLNGDINTRLNDGYLADVDDKGLRIFSVLSLQSLVRKLTLDFRDIFSDGMFYSEINAKAHIKDGVLYTDNAKMKGAAGDLSIKGNTNLVEGNLDYRMSYKPNFSSSLPAIAWIATLNPVTFLGALALDEVLISKVWSEFNFELTGNINDPNLREVNRKSQNISVGRSTPPHIVDIEALPQSDNKKENEQPPKEFNMQDKTDG
ncbi:YhdP family protein [Thalassotalea piscium]